MPRGPGLALRAQLEGKGCKPGCLCCPVIVRPMVNRCVTSTGCDVPEGAKLQDDDDEPEKTKAADGKQEKPKLSKKEKKRLNLRKKSPEEQEKIRKDLLEYCKMDTFAMFKILKVLREKI